MEDALVPTPGGLLEAAHQEAQPVKQCIFARARASMSEELRGELDYMLANRRKYNVSVISRAVNKVGYSMSRASVDHHLRGECACVR